ncbi:MAG: hypothetical protein LWY06_03715 [Firmicutes bacterium]|nr:hypothetical protein [Bacillota bacterium]
MENHEERYLEQIENLIRNISAVQRKFVLDKSGVRAIINFIEQIEGIRPFFELDDPVLQKGKAAALNVTKELSRQLEEISQLTPPPAWENFHATLLESIGMQLKGYGEMVKVFEDSDLKHIEDGQKLVDMGMKILQGGKKEG